MPCSRNLLTAIFKRRCFRTKPEKLLQCNLAFAMLFFETMPVKLYGRSHPAPKVYEGDLLSGSWTLWVSRVEGVKGFLRGSWLLRYNKSKVLTSFKGPKASGFHCEVHGFQGTICQSLQMFQRL